MVREFFYGFTFGLTFNLVGALFVFTNNSDEYDEHVSTREQRQTKTIGCLSGMFCNSIIIGLLIYCFK